MFDRRKVYLNNKAVYLQWIAHDQVCFPIIKKDWEQHSRHWLSQVKRGGTVLQAGGNCGMYPFFYSNIFERTFTFEPDPMNFYCLSENCKSSKVIKMNTALASKPGWTTMGIVDNNNVGMHKVGGGEIKIYGITIDSLNLSELDLLHLDVEGGEFDVLNGAWKTIKRTKPVLVLEMTHEVEKMEEMILDLKYKQTAAFGDPLNKVFVP